MWVLPSIWTLAQLIEYSKCAPVKEAETEPDDSQPHGFHSIKWKWSIPSWGASSGEDCVCGRKIVTDEWFFQLLKQQWMWSVACLFREIMHAIATTTLPAELITKFYEHQNFIWEIWGYEMYRLLWVHKISSPPSFLIMKMQMLDQDLVFHRQWNIHQYQQKSFYCLQSSLELALIETICSNQHSKQELMFVIKLETIFFFFLFFFFPPILHHLPSPLVNSDESLGATERGEQWGAKRKA